MADDSIDIAALIRQRQIMDQLNQITSQGTGAAMLGGGANLRQFDDTGGGTQTTSTGLPQPPSPRRPTSGELSRAPVIRQLQQAAQSLGNRVQGVGGTPTASQMKNAPAAQDIPASQQPTLNINTPANQPTLQRGQQITIDPSTGQPIAVPNPLLRQYTPFMGQ